MHSSKNLALMFVLGAALVGGVLGFSADRLLVQDRLCEPGSRRAPKETLAMKLEFSPAQEATLDSLLDLRRRDMRAALAPVQPALDSISTHADAQIRAIMTPQQQERWNQLRKESQARERARREKENQRN